MIRLHDLLVFATALGFTALVALAGVPPASPAMPAMPTTPTTPMPPAPPEPPPMSAAIAPVATSAASPELSAIIRQLGDVDFVTRERAQKQLQSLPLSQRDALAKIAQTTTDEEIKSRLIQLVDEMDERVATDPPPLSLEVSDASYRQIALALSQATVATIAPGPFAGGGPFTLKTIDQPYWEIVRQLGQQHPIGIIGDPPTMAQQTLPHQRIIRGLFVTASDPKVNIAGKLDLVVNVAFDPRIAVVDLHPLQVDDARDDQGHLLRLEPETGAAGAVGLARRLNTPALRLFQTKTCTFSSADPLGKTFTIKGAVKFLVTISQTTQEIANAGQHLNQAIAIGDSKVTLRPTIRSAPDPAGHTRAALSLEIVPRDSAVPAPPVPNIEISPTGNGIALKGGLGSTAGTRLVIDAEGSTGGIFMGTSATAGGETTRILVTDAQGKTVANYTLPRGLPITSIHTLADTFQEPLTFKFTIPTKTREVAIPFEFKDLPIQR